MILLGRPADESQLSYLGGPGGSLFRATTSGDLQLHTPASGLVLSDGSGRLTEPVVQSGVRQPPAESGLTQPGTAGALAAPKTEGPNSFPGAVGTITGVRWVEHRFVTDEGIGLDEAQMKLVADLVELGVGVDTAVWSATAISAVDQGVGTDRVVETPREAVTDGGLGLDLALRLSRADFFDAGVGNDSGSSTPRVDTSDSGVGRDNVAGIWVELSGLLSETGAGYDTFTEVARLVTTDSAVGADQGITTPGFTVGDLGVGAESPRLNRVKEAVGDRAAGADAVSEGAQEPENSMAGVGNDSSVGWFAPQTWTLNPFTASGSITIPVGCRYVDVVCVGGGGGGQKGTAPVIGASYDGDGGWGGTWAWRSLQRGVDVPWTARTITVTVGAGGAAESNGTASTIVVEGWGTLTGAGGNRRNSVNNDRDGQPPSGGNSNIVSGVARDVVLNGVTYAGGSWSNTDTANVPGAGGRGGAKAPWPLNPGSGKSGARGQAWVRFYQ